MPNVNQNQAISGSITYPGPGQIDRNVPQPRQPHSLQGLLRFAMDVTKSEDAPCESHFLPMDEERKKFLEETIKSMTINVIEQLQQSVKILQNANTLSVDSDTTEYTNAFETILDFVDNIDTANDFHKIGGFMIFQPCLNSVHASIRASACDLLAELCQNNPYCQTVVTDNAMLPLLLNILDTDADKHVCTKALYAISCNVRENEEGYNQLIKNEGIPILLRAMQKPVDKLRMKAAFLLWCLSSTKQDLKVLLCKQDDIIPLLISLIAQERMPSHEHIFSLLFTLLTDNQEAMEKCTAPRLNFKNILTDNLRLIKGKSECQEEEEMCRTLLRTLFGNNETETDR